MNNTTPTNLAPRLSISAAKIILKNVPRSFLLVNTGIIFDAKTMERLGYVDSEIEIVGKKIINFASSPDGKIQINYHKNSNKYIKSRLTKIVQRIEKFEMQPSVAPAYSEVRLAC